MCTALPPPRPAANLEDHPVPPDEPPAGAPAAAPPPSGHPAPATQPPSRSSSGSPPPLAASGVSTRSTRPTPTTTWSGSQKPRPTPRPRLACSPSSPSMAAIAAAPLHLWACPCLQEDGPPRGRPRERSPDRRTIGNGSNAPTYPGALQSFDDTLPPCWELLYIEIHVAALKSTDLYLKLNNGFEGSYLTSLP